MKLENILFMVATLGIASAHTIMNKINNNAQGAGIYMPSDDSPQMDVTSKSMACNGPPVTGFKSSSQKISVTAGSTVTGAWLHTLTSTGSDSAADNKVIASSHKVLHVSAGIDGTSDQCFQGPVLAYMKKVSDATQNPSAGPGDGWFKISEEGLISSSQWAMDKLISNGGIQSVKIPSCIANGDYLLRLEVIALHSASSYPGAQFYMECAQITVTGGTGTKSPSTVSIPGTYSGSDPGIKVNIYNSKGQPYPASYQIPGPPVFTC